LQPIVTVWRTAGEKRLKRNDSFTAQFTPSPGLRSDKRRLRGRREAPRTAGKQKLLKTAFFSLFAKQNAVQSLREGAAVSPVIHAVVLVFAFTKQSFLGGPSRS
jgi:hypothetical protein